MHMESESELVAKWERIHAQHEANEQKCRQREEKLHAINKQVSYLEIDVDRLDRRSRALIDEGLDAISRVITFNRFCDVLEVEVEITP